MTSTSAREKLRADPAVETRMAAGGKV